MIFVYCALVGLGMFDVARDKRNLESPSTVLASTLAAQFRYVFLYFFLSRRSLGDDLFEY